MDKTKLVLGTVQLGMEYGLNNTTGQPNREEAFSILDRALAAGITLFDTAWAYGNAEDVIGEWMQARDTTQKIKIISKMKPHALEDYPNYTEPSKVVLAEVKKSLHRLGVSCLEGYLLHTPQYAYNDGVIAGLREIKSAGLVKNIGVSIYDEAEALRAIEIGADYVQVPYNVLDQRLDKIVFFDRAKEKGVTVFARSPFLQGLLLMDPAHIPPHLAHARTLLEKFADISKRHGLSRLEAALTFAYNSRADYIVFGVETLAQLQDVLALDVQVLVSNNGFLKEVSSTFRNVEIAIVNPSLWNKMKK